MRHYGNRTISLKDSFNAKFQRSSDGCWQWLAYRDRDGYGVFRRQRAHRVAWQLHNGTSIPDGMQVCHHCDNPSCVRPDHLFVGTHLDNSADMVAKNRASRLYGWRRSAKLSLADVAEMRRLRSEQALTYDQLGEMFCVKRNTAWCAVNNKRTSLVDVL